jgi:hypothetical protein
MFVRLLPPDSPATAPSLVGKRARVEFVLTIPLTGIKLQPSSESPLNLEIGGIALTRDDREAGEFLHPVHGSPSPEFREKPAREGIIIREKLDLLPGYYDIRIMSHDLNADKIGTVVFAIEVKGSP